ncbi:transglycosylase domain-containing protein [Lysobacter capsici]|uniref:transglycosylase domain-containing protein n=1 Tax=Lysobacter capsici TaxID=435897 RepID=UPI00287B6A31|nr:transglycosylase domain-containing protein [Lysobacter capsici]WND82322.1 transglycosylase domain-containing protein [Lysobacter capsici]WND87518.1 transglycosylase domain-containing protein [Lysobacter capsici]
MDVLFKRIAAVLATVVALFFLLLQGVYWYGAYDLPQTLPGPRREYSDHARALVWAQSGGRGEIRIRRLSSIGLPLMSLGFSLRHVLAWKTGRFDTTHEPDADGMSDLSLLGEASRNISFSMIASNEPRTATRNEAGEVVHDAATLRQLPARWQFIDMAVTSRLSREWPAERIIDSILEKRYFGHQANGLEQAARTYFDLPVEQLSPSETAALLVIGSAYSTPSCEPDDFRRAYVQLMLRTDFAFNLRDPDADLTRMKLPVCETS